MDLDVQATSQSDSTNDNDDFQEDGGAKKKGVWPELVLAAHAHLIILCIYVRVWTEG